MAWDNAVITNTGLELYAQALQENGITITRAEGGYGTVPAAELREQTAVTPPGTAVPIVDVTKQGAGLKVSLRMNSVGLATGYTVKMLGIYAKSASGGEVLLAVVQDERGELIPPGHETPEYVFELTLLLPLANLERIDWALDPSIFATKRELEETVAAALAADWDGNIDGGPFVPSDPPDGQGGGEPSHANLTLSTHGNLGTKTHDQIRKEVL